MRGEQTGGKTGTMDYHAIPATVVSKLRAATACLAIALVAAVLPSAANAAAPAWEIVAAPYPANFAPGAVGSTGARGPAFSVIARNIGGASAAGGNPAEGGLLIQDKLPAGLVLSATPEGKMFPPAEPLSCSGSAGETTVTCTSPKSLPPGGFARVLIPVEVQEIAKTPPAVLVDQAKVEGGGAATVSSTAPVRISATPAPFDFIEGPSGFYGSLTTPEGAATSQAGSHPFQMTVGLGLPYYINVEPLPTGGGLRNAEVVLPRGFAVNPNVTPERCSATDLERSKCPAGSQVGIVQPLIAVGEYSAPTSGLFNLVPAPGTPAELGFEVVAGVVVHLRGHVRSDGEYALVASSDDVLAKVPVGGVAVTLWGVPSLAAHDIMRGACGDLNLRPTFCQGGKLEDERRSGEPLLIAPGDCTPRPLTVAGTINSWVEPQVNHSRAFSFADSGGDPVGLTGCQQLPFEPSIEAKATTDAADSPTGLNFRLHQRQVKPYEELSPSPVKDVQVTLPPGMTVNAASADGLGACTQAQMGLKSPAGARPIVFNEEPTTCPDASKIGTVSVTTPLLDHALPGSVFLAKPFENPFGSLLAIYLAVEDPQTGIVSKLAGQVQPDPKTGQLTTVFQESPELPLEDISLKIFGGNRASLQTPMLCGAFSTTSRLTPWSTPEGADASPSGPLFITEGAAGTSACPTKESAAPNGPAFTAGTVTPQAGAYSPFVLKVTREDGSQRIGKIETTLPPGVSGKLAGIPYCSEAQIATAKARETANEGAAEIANPSCPLASEVGTVTVGAGAGPTPYYVRGHAYMAGPYKGAPLSLVIITPAVAGPFDLGTVVVRTALNVNLETAQITAVSDPLPTIIDGIPLDVRSVAVDLGRPDFTLNPTSCNPMQVLGSSISTLNQAAPLASRFQVGGCKGLGFKPKLKISLKGPTKRTGHPALKTVITYPKKGAYANIARVQVGLPHAEFLDQANLDKVCTQPELKSNTCPASSIYGHAKAWSPLLEKPLEGPVYLGVGYGHKLPDIVADLNGQVRILAHGRVDTTKKAGLRATFEVVPDAPVSRIVVEMKGGKKYGLLVNSENVCRKTQRASARLVAQNGKVAQLQPKIANSCKHSKSGAKRKKR